MKEPKKPKGCTGFYGGPEAYGDGFEHDGDTCPVHEAVCRDCGGRVSKFGECIAPKRHAKATAFGMDK